MKPQSPQRNEFKSIEKYPFNDITERIISCALEVHTALGPGLLENIYEEAMAHELNLRDIDFIRQKELQIQYKGHNVGNYRLDFLVEEKIVVELKSIEIVRGIHIAQLLTYMRAENLRIGLLINFNVERLKDGLKRVIL